MSNLIEALSRPQITHPGTRCGVGAFLATLDGDDLEAVKAALADQSIQTSDLARRLASVIPDAPKHGAIGRHRRGDCTCA